MTRSLPSSVRSSGSLSALVLAAILGSAACNSPAPSAGAPAAKDSTATATTTGTTAPPAVSAKGSPLSRLVPPARPSRAMSPLVIEPGVSFGPVALGETLADLEKAGLTVVRGDVKSQSFAHIDLPGGTKDRPLSLNLMLCEGKIIDIWIDDLRQTATPVTYAGKTIERSVKLEELERTLDCGQPDRLEGGNMQPCAKGGVMLGTGIGDFVQVRVSPRGFDRYDTCDTATDDGSPVALPEATRVKMLEKILVDRSISPYWHVDRPGRDPLRIVKSPLVPAVPLTMFGSPVVWIEPADARPGTAFLTLTRLDASRTRARLEYTYPIEGVTGTIAFRHSAFGDEWRVEKSEVRER